jgi:hypothetical protein
MRCRRYGTDVVRLTAREARRAPSDAGLFDARQRGGTNPSPVNPNFDRLHESAADEKPARNECATNQPQNENKTTPKPGSAVAE